MLSSLSSTASHSIIRQTIVSSISLPSPLQYWSLNNNITNQGTGTNTLTNRNSRVTFTQNFNVDGGSTTDHSAKFNGSAANSSTTIYTVLTYGSMSLGTAGFTISLWFYKTANSTVADIWLITLTSGAGTLRLVDKGTSDSISWTNSSQVSYTKNRWNHVIVSVGPDKKVYIWLNGGNTNNGVSNVPQIDGEIPSPSYYSGNVVSGTIGGPAPTAGGTAQSLTGHICEVKYYTTIFTNAQAGALYNSYFISS